MKTILGGPSRHVFNMKKGGESFLGHISPTEGRIRRGHDIERDHFMGVYWGKGPLSRDLLLL